MTKFHSDARRYVGDMIYAAVALALVAGIVIAAFGPFVY